MLNCVFEGPEDEGCSSAHKKNPHLSGAEIGLKHP